jgi:threonine/homoserine/homoserine lactone efflux protein
MSDLTEPLVAGLLAGWGVAIPLGAVGVMIVDTGMRRGLRPAAAAAAGVATADFLYAALAAAAGAAIAGLLTPHVHELRLFAAAVLALIAVLGLRALARSPAAVPGSGGDPAGSAAMSPGFGAHPARAGAVVPPARSLYMRFVALTSVNPTTVTYFAALIAGLPAVASAAAEAKVAFVAAAGLASLSWQLVLAGAGAALHRRLPAAARIGAAIAGNALVLGLAVHMALAA